MAGKADWEMARQDYLLAKQLQGLSQRTMDDYDNYTGRFLSYLQDNKLGFTTSSIRAYLASLDVGQVTLGIRIKVLRTFCRWLAAEGYLQCDPMAAIPNPRVPQRVPVLLSDDDLRKLIHVAKKKPRDLALLLVLLDTGIRASECCDLTLEDVDLDTKSLLVKNGKGGKGRYVYVSDLTARSLKRWLALRPDSFDNAVFISEKTHERLTRNSLSQIVKRLGSRAGVKVHPHLLRKVFATRWILLGGDSHSLMVIMGHTSTRMAETYVRLVASDVSALHRQYSPVARIGLG
jgi:integrase/recombinase XerD